jgi:hypothetical protein
VAKANSLMVDLALWVLASPILLVKGVVQCWHRYHSWRTAYTVRIVCRSCGQEISFVGMWRCACGYTYRGHLLRHCPVCGALPRIGALPCVRHDGGPAGLSMRLTHRCRDLLRLLATARWLTTNQIHRRFFPTATADAARKRLRKLAKAGYVVVSRHDRMSPALFTLGKEGRRILEREGLADCIALQRRPPKQLEHFVGINDLRLVLEAVSGLSYFFACWELPAIGWRHALIPDAIFAISQQTFVGEFDRGQETIQFFLKTKMEIYGRGLTGFPLAGLLIVADSEGRMRSLMKAIPAGRLRILFSTIDKIRSEGIDKPLFLDSAGRPACLLEVSSQALVSRREAR